MPYAINNGIRIYWEEYGSGEPLLLLMGLGGTREGWWRILPGLSEHYRVIVFDNRGTGESDIPSQPFSMIEMAEDARSVIDAAQIGSTNLLGLSMGGMIAQELTLNFPERVGKLILAGTFCGGVNAVWAKPQVQEALMSVTVKTPEEAFWTTVPYIYDDSTENSKIEEDLRNRQGKFTSRRAFAAQMQAITSWAGTHSRLGRIEVPTLILHGVNDQLVPFENAGILAGRIPDAKLVAVEKMSHIFMTDQTERSLVEILSFLGN